MRTEDWHEPASVDEVKKRLEAFEHNFQQGGGHKGQEIADIEFLLTKLSNCQAELDEIKGVVGFPGTIALEKHGLSDSLPDVVRYCHREWLDQTHNSQQRYLKEQARADSLESRLSTGKELLDLIRQALKTHGVLPWITSQIDEWFKVEAGEHVCTHWDAGGYCPICKEDGRACAVEGQKPYISPETNEANKRALAAQKARLAERQLPSKCWWPDCPCHQQSDCPFREADTERQGNDWQWEDPHEECPDRCPTDGCLLKPGHDGKCFLPNRTIMRHKEGCVEWRLTPDLRCSGCGAEIEPLTAAERHGEKT